MREGFFAVEIIEPPKCSQGHSLEWTWLAPAGGVDGSLNGTGNAVVLDGDIADCSRFAVWYRALVAEDQELVVFDESYSADLPLKNDTTEALLIATFAASSSTTPARPGQGRGKTKP